MLEVSGKTTDGKFVVQGVYRLHETSGIPLDIILEAIRERGMMPDWEGFIAEAVAAGMSEHRALSKLEPAISDSFGAEMRQIVVARLGK